MTRARTRVADSTGLAPRWGFASMLGGLTLAATAAASTQSSVSVAPVAVVAVALVGDGWASAMAARRLSFTARVDVPQLDAGESMVMEVGLAGRGGTLDLRLQPLGSVSIAVASIPSATRRSVERWAVPDFGIVSHLAIDFEVRELGFIPLHGTALLSLEEEVHVAPLPASLPTPRLATPLTTSVREYVPGDRPSRIDWRATARTGRLHSRADMPDTGTIVVQVDLGPDPQGNDAGACLAVARSVVVDLLRAGRTVRLVTRELTAEATSVWPHRSTSAVVDHVCPSSLELCRRLARVVRGRAIPLRSEAVLLTPELCARSGRVAP